MGYITYSITQCERPLQKAQDRGQAVFRVPGDGGNGLSNMRRRIAEVGGNYELVSEPGKGTRIQLWVPALISSIGAGAPRRVNVLTMNATGALPEVLMLGYVSPSQYLPVGKSPGGRSAARHCSAFASMPGLLRWGRNEIRASVSNQNMKPFLCLALSLSALMLAGKAIRTSAADYPSQDLAPKAGATSSIGNSNDWRLLWQPSGASLPAPVKVKLGSLGDLGQDLENREWLMIPTKYHQVLFQSSADLKKVAELCQLIDGLYVFLDGRSPAKPTTPIQAFLVPDERGRSRCSQRPPSAGPPAMRTGEQGELPFLLTSLLHEETHLFNFAFLGGRPQGWWTGVFCCLYFQERALLEHAGRDVKREVQARLPRGPITSLAELDARGQAAFDEALAAQFFLEEKYGRERSKEFRRQCLLTSKASGAGRLPENIFQQVFGKAGSGLDSEWHKFYGWTNAAASGDHSRSGERGSETNVVADARLDAKVSYAVQKESVQYVVQKLAAQAGLGYDFEKSKAHTDPLCRQWVNNMSIQNRACREALNSVLDPAGLRYEIEGGAIVLYRK